MTSKLKCDRQQHFTALPIFLIFSIAIFIAYLPADIYAQTALPEKQIKKIATVFPLDENENSFPHAIAIYKNNIFVLEKYHGRLLSYNPETKEYTDKTGAFNEISDRYIYEMKSFDNNLIILGSKNIYMISNGKYRKLRNIYRIRSFSIMKGHFYCLQDPHSVNHKGISTIHQYDESFLSIGHISSSQISTIREAQGHIKLSTTGDELLLHNDLLHLIHEVGSTGKTTDFYQIDDDEIQAIAESNMSPNRKIFSPILISVSKLDKRLYITYRNKRDYCIVSIDENDKNREIKGKHYFSMREGYVSDIQPYTHNDELIFCVLRNYANKAYVELFQ